MYRKVCSQYLGSEIFTGLGLQPQVREKTGLTQTQFASTFGISLGTLRYWERGDRKPHGPALVLLNAANNAPDELLNILSGRMIRPNSKKSNSASRTRMAA